MTSRQSIGRKGEKIARQYLQRKGYAFRGKNVRMGHHETDLLMFDPVDECLVFIEVKTRSSFDQDFGPEANMTHAKRENMRRAARKWIAQYEYDGGWRLDVILVLQECVVDHWIQV